MTTQQARMQAEGAGEGGHARAAGREAGLTRGPLRKQALHGESSESLAPSLRAEGSCARSVCECVCVYSLVWTPCPCTCSTIYVSVSVCDVCVAWSCVRLCAALKVAAPAAAAPALIPRARHAAPLPLPPPPASRTPASCYC